MQQIVDLLIIGGGINGAGIAADAAGRGLSVMLCEQGDLASGTSSASTKLIHGGLRYLEQYEFRLVAKALKEREVLIKRAPHLIQPLQFIMPHEKHLRPAWLIRLGLFLYDHLAKRKKIPGSSGLNLRQVFQGKDLQKKFKKGFSYYDCRTDDSRLVILNALLARQNGANILTHTRCLNAKKNKGYWQVLLQDEKTQKQKTVYAKIIVNAAGPWVMEVLKNILHQKTDANIKLVQGSHIVVPKLYEGEHAYILQNKDRRIAFTIPYHQNFTLIGTTDVLYQGEPQQAKITKEEKQYLCHIINHYFKAQITPRDVVWSYVGVRPLYDNYSRNPSKISRDYHFELNSSDNVTQLSIFGGKLTTFRVLAEEVVNKLQPFFPAMKNAWTAEAFLPGGDLQGLSFPDFVKQLQQKYARLSQKMIIRFAYSYGSLSYKILGESKSESDLGLYFGAGLYQREVDYLCKDEWALTAEDILWRRSKLGLYFSHAQEQKLQDYLRQRFKAAEV